MCVRCISQRRNCSCAQHTLCRAQDVTTLKTPDAVMSAAHQSAYAPPSGAPTPTPPHAASAHGHSSAAVPAGGEEEVTAQIAVPKVERVVEFEQESGGEGGGDERDGGGAAVAAGTGAGGGLVSELGEAELTVVYALEKYVLKVPQVDTSSDRVSSVADKILLDVNNELFVTAVIQHESMLPCPVVRTQVCGVCMRAFGSR